MRLTLVGMALGMLACPFASALGQSGKYGELLQRLPDQANALMIVDVEGLFNSPIGKREQWQDKAANRLAGALGAPANVSTLAVAAGVDLTTLQERWKFGMLKLTSNPPALDVLAKREGGYIEQIQTQTVAWTPRDFYLLSFPNRILGFAVPSDRQLLSNWAKTNLSKLRPFPSGWADRAIAQANAGAPIVLAIDLANAVAPKQAEVWLSSIDVPNINSQRAKFASMAMILSHAKSAVLKIDVKDAIEGTIEVDFEGAATAIAPLAKDLILATLETVGAQIEELGQWKAAAGSANSIALKGPLSVNSVRHILGVVSAPSLTPMQGDSAPSDTSSQTRTAPPADVALKATQAYFRSVVDITDKLRKQKTDSYKGLKLWYDRYAKQIEELPLLNVDSELLDWGSKVARGLRNMAVAMDYSKKDQAFRIAGTANGGYYGDYGNGYGYVGGSRAVDASTIKTQSNAMLSTAIGKGWQDLETEIAGMRRKMVDKYKVDF